VPAQQVPLQSVAGVASFVSLLCLLLGLLDFAEAKSDTSLFVYCYGADTACLLLYVDDIVLTVSSLELLQCTTTALQ
jgi:hypothetical protein